MPTRRAYHHGDLRRSLIDAAVVALAADDPASLSLRSLARDAGVSHAAPVHHFGDKRGLLTAVATQGYHLLAAELAAAWEASHDFLEVGVAYVRFAIGHRGHFSVMFRPDLVDTADEDLVAARAASAALLYGPVSPPGIRRRRRSKETLSRGIAAWSLVHGLAQLWLDGNIPAELGDDPEKVAALVARHLAVTR